MLPSSGIPNNGNISILTNSYQLNNDEVEDIIQNVLMGEIGDELPDENMQWIINFENLLKDDPSLITNRELTFNYFILKTSHFEIFSMEFSICSPVLIFLILTIPELTSSSPTTIT